MNLLLSFLSVSIFLKGIWIFGYSHVKFTFISSPVGSPRRGKSWFANVLHGRHDGFELGAEVDGCTHGIYMWSPPFKLTSKQSDGITVQKRVIVLDTEGINDSKQDQNWATKLFMLCL